MLDKLKKMFQSQVNPGAIISSPVNGKIVPIGDVSDPTFADEILGKSIAIIPHTNRVVAPVNGTVEIMFETGHAVSIVSDEGTELLIHIGIDTVKLNGQFFKAYVKSGDKVSMGDTLIEFDEAQIKSAGYDTVIPIVICNSPNYTKIECTQAGTVKELEQLMILHRK
jgi:glucose-specific phosphotransferase system IIA component